MTTGRNRALLNSAQRQQATVDSCLETAINIRLPELQDRMINNAEHYEEELNLFMLTWGITKDEDGTFWIAA